MLNSESNKVVLDKSTVFVLFYLPSSRSDSELSRPAFCEMQRIVSVRLSDVLNIVKTIPILVSQHTTPRATGAHGLDGCVLFMTTCAVMGHKDEVDNDIAARERVEDAFSETHPAPAELKEKLERARRQLQTPSS
jgi:hypothetical protein